MPSNVAIIRPHLELNAYELRGHNVRMAQTIQNNRHGQATIIQTQTGFDRTVTLVDANKQLH